MDAYNLVQTSDDIGSDLLERRNNGLDYFFHPRSVAVIGASEKEGSVGMVLLRNLLSHSFGGMIFPVNKARRSVLGIKAYPDIASVPDPVDLAVVVTPAPTVPDIVSQCIAAGVKAVVVISAGFKETGATGLAFEEEIRDRLRGTSTRLIGPNCLGIMNPLIRLNATFAADTALPGKVAFISQSGALCTAILDWSLKEKVGFSAFVSLGSMLDVSWGDLIDYLGNDPNTSSIVMYMETIGDSRAFLSAAREVALTKPIIIIKGGRSEEAAKAAASHTGSLAGSDQVLDAAFDRCGVLRVNTIAELFYMAEVLSKQPRPTGKRLAIVTNAGGPGVLTTDALISGGGELAALSDLTMKRLDQCLPTHWSHNNPVDVIGDAGPDTYANAVEAVLKDPEVDGVLVILTLQAMTDSTRTALKLATLASDSGKPVLASWMGGSAVEAGQAILNNSGIPAFPYPDTAARVFNHMWRYSENLKSLYETPEIPIGKDAPPNRTGADTIIADARAQDRTILSEYESKRLLACYGIPTVRTELAKTSSEAVKLAEIIGFPVVLKLHSHTITHKTEVGGVLLDIKSKDEVKSSFEAIRKSVAKAAGDGHFLGVTVQPMAKAEGYELIYGSSVDPQFGPVLLFGWGGQLVEVIRDRALALPPLNTNLARRLIRKTLVYQALQGVRGRTPVDLAAVEANLVRFSDLILEQPWIRELDINPMMASSQGVLALDARVVLYDRDTLPSTLPRTAIRPYPTQYMDRGLLEDDTPILFRPIRPEDEPLMVRFHQHLSERSVYFRYFQAAKLSYRASHERLTRICFIDYDREMALVAEAEDRTTKQKSILGVGRLSKDRDGGNAEFALIVSDPYQGQGLGRELLTRILDIARNEHVQTVRGNILPENLAMRSLCEKLGFHLTPAAGENLLVATIRMKPS